MDYLYFCLILIRFTIACVTSRFICWWKGWLLVGILHFPWWISFLNCLWKATIEIDIKSCLMILPTVKLLVVRAFLTLWSSPYFCWSSDIRLWLLPASIAFRKNFNIYVNFFWFSFRCQFDFSSHFFARKQVFSASNIFNLAVISWIVSTVDTAFARRWPRVGEISPRSFVNTYSRFLFSICIIFDRIIARFLYFDFQYFEHFCICLLFIYLLRFLRLLNFSGQIYGRFRSDLLQTAPIYW